MIIRRAPELPPSLSDWERDQEWVVESSESFVLGVSPLLTRQGNTVNERQGNPVESGAAALQASSLSFPRLADPV